MPIVLNLQVSLKKYSIFGFQPCEREIHGWKSKLEAFERQPTIDVAALLSTSIAGKDLVVSTWTRIFRLLSMEHVVKNGKLLLSLIFEYFDTDLNKFIDSYRDNVNVVHLPPKII